MSEPTERDKRIRIFVALDLPAPLRAGIAAWGEAELGDPALRVVPAEALHVTLAFLGSRPPAEAESVAAAMAECAAPAPLLELSDPEPRPGRGRPKVFALPAVAPGAEQLQAQLVEALASAGLYEAEKRPFWPHVTVARVRAEGRGSRRPRQVERLPGSLPAQLREPHFSGRLTLYRSELQPSGARYVPLAQIELPGAGSSEV